MTPLGIFENATGTALSFQFYAVDLSWERIAQQLSTMHLHNLTPPPRSAIAAGCSFHVNCERTCPSDVHFVSARRINLASIVGGFGQLKSSLLRFHLTLWRQNDSASSRDGNRRLHRQSPIYAVLSLLRGRYVLCIRFLTIQSDE